MKIKTAPVIWFQTSESESWVKTAKLSGFVRRHAPPPSQQFAHLVGGLGHVVVRGGFHADEVLLSVRDEACEKWLTGK